MSKPNAEQRKKFLTAADLEKYPPIVKLFIGRIGFVNNSLKQTLAYIKEAIETKANVDVVNVVIPHEENATEVIIQGYAFAFVRKSDANAVVSACDGMECYGMHATDRDGNVIKHTLRDGTHVYESTKIVVSIASEKQNKYFVPKGVVVTA